MCVKDRGRESKGHSDVVIFLMFFISTVLTQCAGQSAGPPAVCEQQDAVTSPSCLITVLFISMMGLTNSALSPWVIFFPLSTFSNQRVNLDFVVLARILQGCQSDCGRFQITLCISPQECATLVQNKKTISFCRPMVMSNLKE